MRRLVVSLLVGGAVCGASDLRAQVGYEPNKSPYRDLLERQEVSFYSGYYFARRDPAGVAPRRGPLVGAHYQWRASGPANLTADISRVESERRVLDPERPVTCAAGTDCKAIGTFRWPLYMFDAGLALDLTGARSFFRMVPTVRIGGGLMSDFHTSTDVGDFGFGTRFAFTWGAGIRWVPEGRYQIRADFINHLHSLNYPDSYFRPADDGSLIFGSRQSRSGWLNNPALTIGVSYRFSK